MKKARKRRTHWFFSMSCLKICILVIVFTTLSLNGFGQKITFNYKGSWSEWQKIATRGDSYLTSTGEKTEIEMYSNGSGFILKSDPGQIVYFDFRITNYRVPSKDEIKWHWKANQWYEYQGTVSYYVSDDCPTAEAIAKGNQLVIPNPRQDVTPRVKRTANATIKIAPYKDRPAVYNIWFDDIGIGFSRQGLNFEGEKRHKKKGVVAAKVILSTVFFPYGLLSLMMNSYSD